MERIHALIGQLHQQSLQNATPAHLLMTVQLIQAELVGMQQKNGTLGTSKVAVTLPVNLNFSEEVVRPQPVEAAAPPPAPAPIITPPTPQFQPEPEPELVSPYVAPAVAASTSYMLNKPRDIHQPAAPVAETVVHEEPVSVYAPATQVLNPAFNAVAEAPTLSLPREVHEAVGQQQESLNDRLKQEKTEVVHALKDTPIKDLRKGVGINDRFTFVNELFRGDEAMYERSIKTINSFHILSEAEYWINRELKFKLGWNDSKDTVQHFYQLVRRRFS